MWEGISSRKPSLGLVGQKIARVSNLGLHSPEPARVGHWMALTQPGVYRECAGYCDSRIAGLNVCTAHCNLQN